jgi:hypothetical protein
MKILFFQQTYYHFPPMKGKASVPRRVGLRNTKLRTQHSQEKLQNQANTSRTPASELLRELLKD